MKTPRTSAPVGDPRRFQVVESGADIPESALELVGLEYIQGLVGDRSQLATRRWTERLRAQGVLRAITIPGSRKLRFRKAEVLALLSGSRNSDNLLDSGR